MTISDSPIYAREVKDWVNRYNLAAVAKDSTPTDEAISYASNTRTVVCSSLLRSSMSAEILKINVTLSPDQEMVEAGIPYAEWGGIRLSPKYWAVLFRLLWFLGYSKNSESYSQAKNRAIVAAGKLAQQAVKDGPVLFVGHGIFNKYLLQKN